MNACNVISWNWNVKFQENNSPNKKCVHVIFSGRNVELGVHGASLWNEIGWRRGQKVMVKCALGTFWKPPSSQNPFWGPSQNPFFTVRPIAGPFLRTLLRTLPQNLLRTLLRTLCLSQPNQEIPEKSGKAQKGQRKGQKRKDKSRSGSPRVWNPSASTGLWPKTQGKSLWIVGIYWRIHGGRIMDMVSSLPSERTTYTFGRETEQVKTGQATSEKHDKWTLTTWMKTFVGASVDTGTFCGSFCGGPVAARKWNHLSFWLVSLVL